MKQSTLFELTEYKLCNLNLILYVPYQAQYLRLDLCMLHLFPDCATQVNMLSFVQHKLEK